MLATELVRDSHGKEATLVMSTPKVAPVAEAIDHVHLLAELDQVVLPAISSVERSVRNKHNLVVVGGTIFGQDPLEEIFNILCVVLGGCFLGCRPVVFDVAFVSIGEPGNHVDVRHAATEADREPLLVGHRQKHLDALFIVSRGRLI